MNLRCVRRAGGPGGPTDKKKYAIRDIRASSHLESGESAWKAEVLPLHQWRLFRAQHRWVRSDENSHRSIMFHKYCATAKTARDFFARAARSRELTKLFRSCITFTSTGMTVSSLRIATYALCAAAQFQKLKEHWQFQEQHATTNNSSPRNNRRSPGAATTVAAAL